MNSSTSGLESLVRAGDIDGLGTVYSESGGILLRPTESILVQLASCDLAAYGSWRMFFPKRIFHPLPGNPSGTVYITSERLVFLRKIDSWKEVKPLLTPLGLPAAAEKGAKLRRLEARGARQYCEALLSRLELAHMKRTTWSSRFRLRSRDGRKYELFLRTRHDDPAFFDSLERAMRTAILSK